MKIAKIIDTCAECPNGKRFIDDSANHGYVLICLKSKRLISINKVLGHQHRVDPVNIPEWCEMEDYKGENKPDSL